MIKRIIYLLLIASLFGCSNKPELSCSSPEVIDVVTNRVYLALLGEQVSPIAKAQNRSGSSLWSEVFPTYKVELKNIALTGKKKDIDAIVCSAEISSDLFDVNAALNHVNVRFSQLADADPRAGVGVLISTMTMVSAVGGVKNIDSAKIAFEVQSAADKQPASVMSSVPTGFDLQMPNNIAYVSYVLNQMEIEQKRVGKILSGDVQNVQDTNAVRMWGPSFECSKITTEAEKIICNAKDLSDMDVNLEKSFTSALSKADANKVELRNTQLNWIKNIRDKCTDTPCLKAAYETREKELI